MKNSNLSEHLMPGDVLHCTGNSFLSNAIQLFCRSRVNHTAFVIEIAGIIYVIDSDAHGVNPKLLSKWIEKNNYKFYVSRPDSSVYNIDALTVKALSKAGVTNYDFGSLFIHQIKYQVTGKWSGRTNSGAEKSMYCSEFVAWIFDLKFWYSLSPQDVFDYMLTSPNFRNVPLVL